MLQNRSGLTERLFQVKFKDETTNLRKTEAGVWQGNVLGPVLHLIYTSDLPTSDNKTTATFADVTEILTTHEDPASLKLQATINRVDDWAKKWRIKIHQSKCTHITFTLRNQACPNVDLPQKNEVKYLGIHLDRRLTWAKHIKSERKELNQNAKQMNGLLGKRSTLSIESKLLVYKAVLKPV
jgi:hypothetical protein